MENLKIMSEQELARRIVKYIKELIVLRDIVAEFLNSGINADFSKIDLMRDSYKKLKEEIKADAHYLHLLKNKDRTYDLYNLLFAPSIEEASAFGFTASINSRIDMKFYSSVEEALYRMKKYKSLEKWEALVNGGE